MLSRRSIVGQAMALAVFPAYAAKVPPPPRIAAIRWPGPGHDLHGYMAIPAKARGRQPAILVVPDTGGIDKFALSLTDALAVAGFVTCIAKGFASLEEAQATVHWLANNAYATGKVAAIGIGQGADLVDRMAQSRDRIITASVTFAANHPGNGLVPSLHLGEVGSATADAYQAQWQNVVAFLKEHLR